MKARFLTALLNGCCFLLLRPVAAQQLQGAHWFFGSGVGIDFTQGAPRFEAGGQTTQPREIAASVSDAAGRLLFYANSAKVWNRQHQVMPHGQLPTGLGAMMAAPLPGHPTTYYLFQPNGTFGYTVVEMARNGGYGDVVPDSTGSALRIVARGCGVLLVAAMPHANGRDTWIVTHADTAPVFQAWLLSPQGLASQPVLSRVGMPRPRYAGSSTWLKAAPGGRLLAYVTNLHLELLELDPATGRLSAFRAPVQLHQTTPADTIMPGLSFSPDNSRLYYSLWINSSITGTNSAELHQLDLTQPDSLLLATRRRIAHRFRLNAPQLGPDGRLYCTSDTLIAGQRPSQLNVIECPDELGPACRLRMGAVIFPQGCLAIYPPVLNETFFRNAGTLQVVATNAQPCLGDTVTLTAFGAGTTGFSWAAAPGVAAGTPGPRVRFVATVPGTYLVTATRPCGPPLTAQLTVQPQARPAVPLAAYGSGVLTTTAPGPWQWLLDGVPVFGATQASYVPTRSGAYSVVVGSGCTAESAPVSVLVSGLAAEAASAGPLMLWPNPAHHTVQVSGGAGELVLLDAQGRAVRRAAVPATVLDVRGLPAGLYLVRRGAATRRLVVE